MGRLLKVMLGLALIPIVILFVIVTLTPTPPHSLAVVNSKPKSPANPEESLVECFRQTIRGKHAFEMPSYFHPEIRYFAQLSSEDDAHKAAWLAANACLYEVTPVSEKCQATGDSAVNCVMKTYDLALATIKTSEK